ncbi:MAG TPA: hypothetical protein VLL72_01685, partial [Kiloniellales bacterium]|nr:hypothetical protein [Kiloniellales bacterium]
MPITEPPPRLDSPGCFGATSAKASRSFREMRFANRWFGGARSVLAQLPAVLGNLPDRELRVL